MVNENGIGNIIVDTAVALHKELGPGLLETVYEVILAHELERHGLSVDRQVCIPNIENNQWKYRISLCVFV